MTLHRICSKSVSEDVIEYKKMSLYSRERKKRIRTFKRVFMKNAIEVKDNYFWQVHQVPESISKETEFDYWVFNQKDLILLTLKNTDPFVKEVRKTDPRDNIRVFIGLPLKSPEDIKLETIIPTLEKIRKKKKKR